MALLPRPRALELSLSYEKNGILLNFFDPWDNKYQLRMVNDNYAVLLYKTACCDCRLYFTDEQLRSSDLSQAICSDCERPGPPGITPSIAFALNTNPEVLSEIRHYFENVLLWRGEPLTSTLRASYLLDSVADLFTHPRFSLYSLDSLVTEWAEKPAIAPASLP